MDERIKGRGERERDFVRLFHSVSCLVSRVLMCRALLSLTSGYHTSVKEQVGRGIFDASGVECLFIISPFFVRDILSTHFSL